MPVNILTTPNIAYRPSPCWCKFFLRGLCVAFNLYFTYTKYLNVTSQYFLVYYNLKPSWILKSHDTVNKFSNLSTHRVLCYWKRFRFMEITPKNLGMRKDLQPDFPIESLHVSETWKICYLTKPRLQACNKDVKCFENANHYSLLLLKNLTWSHRFCCLPTTRICLVLLTPLTAVVVVNKIRLLLIGPIKVTTTSTKSNNSMGREWNVQAFGRKSARMVDSSPLSRDLCEWRRYLFLPWFRHS